MATTQPLSMNEFRALSALAGARRDVLVNTFKGTQLKFGTVERVVTAKKLLKSAKKLSSVSKKATSGAAQTAKAAPSIPGLKQAVEAFIVQCADVDGLDSIIEAISSEILQELVAEITPFLGIVVSGGKLAMAGKKVAEDGYNLYKSYDYIKGFNRGDPMAAAEAVQSIIKRDLAKHSIQLGQQALATGGKLAGILGDGGTATTVAIGAANALASLGLELYSLGMDIKEMRAGNARLNSPATLDLTVFEECPILGCYLLTCADTSSIANFFLSDIGLPGWMDRLEQMKKKQMDPMLKIARKSIESSRLQLEGLAQNRVTHAKKGFFASIKRTVTG